MSNDIGSQEMSFTASDQQELQLADAVSTPGLQEFSAFSEVSQPHDLTLATHPSFCSQSVGETMATPPIHQPAVGQTHSNYLPVHSGLTTEFQQDENASSPTIETNKGLHNTTESVRKIEPLQDTTEAPQMDNPISDKTSARNQTSVYETSLNSDSSVNETNNHIPENEISTSNLELPIIDEPPPSNNPPMDTTPLSSHPSLDEPPPSHHPPEDGTSPSHHSPHDGTSPSNQAPVDEASSSNLPPVDETSSSKHPPAGGTSPNSQLPIVDGTSESPNNHPSGDKTTPSQHPPMSYIVAPLSSHSLADECQSSQCALVDGTSPSSHPGPPIINGTTPSNHASADKTTPSKCLSVDKPPSDKHPLADFSDNQQLVDDSLPNKKVPVEVPSRINHPAECEPQMESKLATNRALLLDETPSDHLPICKTSDFFSSQVPTDKLNNQPPIDDKSCDKHTQREIPSRYREEVVQLLEKLPLSLQSRPFPRDSSSIKPQGKKKQLFQSSNLGLKGKTDIVVAIDGDQEGTRFSLHHACRIGDDNMTRCILKSSTNPTIQDIRGYTALHYACRGEHFACVKSLLYHSDDPIAFLQVPSNDGATPLSIRSETSGETLLHLACNSKDQFVLQKLLKAGADPNAKDNSGLTPLMILVLSGVVSSSTSDMVDALHSHGCNLNAALEVSETNLKLQPWNGWTALHMAVGKQPENGYSDCIKSLISCGASIQVTDAQGHTPLHIACIVGYFDNLDLLAPNKDYFKIKDSSGCMPLYYVCRYGHCEYFRKVLSHSRKKLLQVVNTDGATLLTVVDEDGRTILHHACREGYDGVTIDLLEANADPSIKDSQGYTPFHYACKNGHDTCIQAIIFYSCMDPSGLPEIKDANGRIPLHIACMQQHHHIIRILKPSLEHFLISDDNGCTPLYYVCKNGDCQCMAVILDLISHDITSLLTARINASGVTPLTFVDKDSKTMLHHACRDGYETVINHLLEAGADPTVLDSQSCTPLHYACKNGHDKCVEAMFHSSVKPSDLILVQDATGCTPLHTASKTRNYHLITISKPILEHLLIKNNDGYTPLYYICRNGDWKYNNQSLRIACATPKVLTAKISTDGTTFLTVVDKKGRTMLHHVCRIGNDTWTQLLLQAGADPTVQDSQGYTPLHYACKRGNICCVHLLSHSPKNLLQAVNTDGATPLTVVDEEGRTILHQACREGYNDVTIDLLEAGADPSIKDSQGYTPLHYACENGHDKCVQAIFYSSKDHFGLPEMKNVNGHIPLHIVCIQQHHHIVRIIKPSFKNFLISDDNGYTPLHYVCKNGDCQCMAEICDLISDETPGISSLLTAAMNTGGTTPLTFVDEKNQTMLHHACRDGYETVINHLLEAGADPTVLDRQSCTPLHYACKNGHDKCVKAMFRSSVKLSDLILIQDASGCTPLHTASKTRHYCLFTILKFSLKPLLIMNNDGYTPLYYICHNSDWQYIIRLSIRFTLSNLLTAKISTDGTTLLTVVDETGQTMLLHVCKGEGIEIWAQRLLEAGADPSVQDSQGNTPLHYACKRGDICCVSDLLHYSRNPSTLLQIKNKEGVTPLSMRMVSDSKLSDKTILHLACDKKHIVGITKLLKAGANPNIKDGSGFTPLMRVITSDLTDSTANDIVTILCEFNCDVNLKRHKFSPAKKNAQIWEGTALHMAAKLGSKPLCVQTLTAQCTTAVGIRDDLGRIPLHIAAINGHHSLMQYLRLPHDHEYLCTKDIFGCTPLYYACKGGNYPCIKYMFKYIPNDSIQRYVEIANNTGTTPLTVADTNGRTALHHALHEGDVKLACKLLRVGADLAVEDHLGCTPLTIRSESDSTFLHHLCTGEGTFDLIDEILKAGADPNVKDNDGYTPFMLALKYIDDSSAFRILTALRDFQHDLSITTSLSRTALHIATENNKAKCVELLIAQGADLLAKTLYGKTSSHIACVKGHAKSLSHFLTEKCIASVDATGSTPLHYACKYGHVECVRKIVFENDSLNLQFQITKLNLDGATPLTVTNNQGRTILHQACVALELPLVQKILKYGACPNAKDYAGFTPLMLTLQAEKFSEILLGLTEAMVSSTLWDPHIKDSRGWTVLHYAARYEDVRLACVLLVAGCDISAEDNNGQTFSNLMPRTSLQLLNKQLLRIDRRQIVCVIGHPKSGKSTLVAAFQQAPRGTLRKVSSFLQSDKIILTDTSRTAGINTATFSDDKLGNIIFFDFAGQSEYYASHLAFLESALASKGATITFMMVVDLRLSEEERFSQCMEWLFPIKSIVNDHNVLNVVLIGSHQDQLKSISSTSSAQSLNNTLQKLKATLDTSQIHFIDSWGMDCRRLSSKGITHLQDYLKSIYSSLCESDESRQVPIGPSLLFHKLKIIENPPLAITPSMIIDKFKDGHSPFPLTVPHIDKYCQDLAASGLVIYIPNREDAGRSWLILKMEEVLSCVHGKLFAPDSRKFPMRYKNLANQFGLVQADELKLAFSEGLLDPDMVQKLLMSMEFCHPVDSTLMADETIALALEISRAVFQSHCGSCSTVTNYQEEWLFFPSLVKADSGALIMSTECDVPSEGCHWVCWELTTVNPHFFTPRLQQAVFIRLTCSYVQKQRSSHSSVKKHSCTVSKNAMSWSTIHGIDICVQIIRKSVIKVLARTRPGVNVSSLMDLVSDVVADILKTHANHSPGVDVFSVFREIKQGIPGEHSVIVSSIIESVEASGSYVNSKEHPPKLISLKDLFLDWEVSKELLEKMHINTCKTDLFISTASENGQCHDTVTSVQNIDPVNRVQQSQTPGPSLEDLYSILSTAESDVVTAKWKQFACHNLGVLDDLIQTAEQIICDSCSGKYRLLQDKDCLYYVLEAWLAKEEGTGDLPRTWETVLSALEDSGISIDAAKVEESLEKQYLTLLREEMVTEADLLDLVESRAYEKWNEFAINLGVQQNIREGIAFDSQRVAKDNFIEVVYRWLSYENGTGDNPRTWITVVKALREIGCPVPPEDLERKLLQLLYQKSNGDLIVKDNIESSQQTLNDLKDTVSQTNLKEQLYEEEFMITKETSTTVAGRDQEGGVNGSGAQQNKKYLEMKPTEEQLVRLVGSQMFAKWNMFSLYLGVQKHVRDEVSHNCQRMAKGCFVEVVGRWLSSDDGTGDSPRTWETVFSALEDIGHAPLTEEVKQKLCQSGALAKVLEEKNHGTSEAIRNDSEDMQVVINEPSSLNFVQTEANRQGELPSLLENIEREEITTRPHPVVTIHKQLPCELEPPTTSVEDEEDDCNTQQKQIFLQVKPTEEELARFVCSQMCAEWNTFSVYLGVQKHIRDKVCYNCSRMAEDCFIEVVGRWLSYEDGTGVNCRTWETVFSALKGAGYPSLVEEVEQKLSNRQKLA